MDKFEVDNKGEFMPAWISYLSTAVGILRACGEETDLVDTGGYSGYAFHINTSKYDTCPSAPTVAPFELFREGLEALGRKVTFGWVGPEYSPSDAKEDIARAKEFFEDIKTILRETNRPIGIWGIPVPEFGIVNGFEGDKYLVSTFRSLQSKSREEDPIHFTQIHAPGGLSKLIIGDNLDSQDQGIIDQEVLKRAVYIAKGVKFEDDETNANYVTGPDALSQWAEILEKGVVPKSEEDSRKNKGKLQLTYHGNSYVAQCTKEGMDLAASFLMRLHRRYKSEIFSEYLEEAFHQYKHAGEKFRIFTELFPFSLELDWKEDVFNKEKRKIGAQLLKDAKPHVLAAIENMEKAFDIW